METLRVAFLSALVLELVATVSVALVAVPIGLRLLSGDLDLRTAFLILLLAPEVYLPLRAMGSQFHAAQEGLTALDDAFAVLPPEPDRQASNRPRPGDSADETPAEVPPPPDAVPAGEALPRNAAQRDLSVAEASSAHTGQLTGSHPHMETVVMHSPLQNSESSIGEIVFDDVTVAYRDRPAPALDGVDAAVSPGDLVALTGPSGAGKTTLLNLLLGFAPLSSGRVTCGSTDIAGLDNEAWLRNIAWVPQRAHLFAVSLADNIRLGQPRATLSDVRLAAEAASVTEFVDELPDGFDTVLGEAGYGLSAGQRRRLALARAFLRIRALDCPLVL
ncbi:MAG: ATP-binding cassette domain-containing protein, partial [Stackebrandtia sp.]